MKLYEELKWRGLIKDEAGEDLKDKLNNSLNFNTYHIPDGIIASLVDEIRVYNDRFEWKLKIFNDKATINTGVDANKNASIITDNFPSYWDSSTGSYR